MLEDVNVTICSTSVHGLSEIRRQLHKFWFWGGVLHYKLARFWSRAGWFQKVFRRMLCRLSRLTLKRIETLWLSWHHGQRLPLGIEIDQCNFMLTNRRSCDWWWHILDPSTMPWCMSKELKNAISLLETEIIQNTVAIKQQRNSLRSDSLHLWIYWKNKATRGELIDERAAICPIHVRDYQYFC